MYMIFGVRSSKGMKINMMGPNRRK